MMSTNKPVLGTTSVFNKRFGRNAQMYRDNQSKPGYYFGDGQYGEYFLLNRAPCLTYI
jgi:hypothetical protein